MKKVKTLKDFLSVPRLIWQLSKANEILREKIDEVESKTKELSETIIRLDESILKVNRVIENKNRK